MTGKPLLLVLVEWMDSYNSDPSWKALLDYEAPKEPLTAVSVGSVVSESSRYLVIVPHILNQVGCGEMTIPKRAIVRRATLKLPWKVL